jgi:hypothetical protein
MARELVYSKTHSPSSGCGLDVSVRGVGFLARNAALAVRPRVVSAHDRSADKRGTYRHRSMGSQTALWRVRRPSSYWDLPLALRSFAAQWYQLGDPAAGHN